MPGADAGYLDWTVRPRDASRRERAAQRKACDEGRMLRVAGVGIAQFAFLPMVASIAGMVLAWQFGSSPVEWHH